MYPDTGGRALLRKLDQNVQSRSFYENRTSTSHYQVQYCYSTLKRINFKNDDYVFLKWYQSKGYNSLLDIGCGAGAFYELISKECPTKYMGIDYSRVQIDNALKLYPDENFQVKDAGEIDIDLLRNYDALHAWSVFAFMPKSKVLNALSIIMESELDTFLTISCTRKNKDFVPDEHISVRKGDVFMGRQNIAIDYYPYIEDLQEINKKYGNKYHFIVEELEHGKQWCPSINLTKFSSKYFGAFSYIIIRIGLKIFTSKYKYLKVKMVLKDDLDLFNNLFENYENVGEKGFSDILSM
jgi:SAM-dependent methyltransferase